MHLPRSENRSVVKVIAFESDQSVENFVPFPTKRQVPRITQIACESLLNFCKSSALQLHAKFTSYFAYSFVYLLVAALTQCIGHYASQKPRCIVVLSQEEPNWYSFIEMIS